jgi:hypothetical protein
MISCHDRIRRFIGLAQRLGGDDPLPPGEVATAAAAVRRYFEEALPLHAADEDLSLRPRLLAAGVPPEVEEALGRMAEEHLGIEEALGGARLLWGALAADPMLRAARRAELSAAAHRLDALFLAHLAPEESLIFPLARRCLGPRGLEALGLEMRQRRAPGP